MTVDARDRVFHPLPRFRIGKRIQPLEPFDQVAVPGAPVCDVSRGVAVEAGAEDTTGTSAEAYRVWYRIALPDGAEGWVRAATAVANDTGSDGRPSSVRFDFLPAVETPTT